jgi:type IV secretion system protein VirB10
MSIEKQEEEGAASESSRVRKESASSLSEEGSDSRSRSAANETADAAVLGERGKPSVNRFRSVQSRISSLLTLTLLSALALGLLAWYYTQHYTRRVRTADAAHQALQRRLQGDAPPPSLGPIEPPALLSTASFTKLLGEAPALPNDENAAKRAHRGARKTATHREAQVSPQQAALDRKLQGPVFVRSGDARRPGAVPLNRARLNSLSSLQDKLSGERVPEIDADGDANLADYLKPTRLEAARAQVLPTQRLLLPKGAFIDCTLETAINSMLPGLATCVTATDTYSADGTVVLLERGTKLIGETRGAVKEGMSRLFVLWAEARTPHGVVIPLASPATDALGRSGISGEVNRHFFARFGAALLISIVDAAGQAAVRSGSDGDIIINPSGSREIVTEVLRASRNIPPTIDKAQGEPIQILVARDIDFRSVYALSVRTRKIEP